MRVFCLAESPPSTDARYGNGSTMISCHLLQNLPEDVRIDLAYFDDRPVPVDPGLRERLHSVVRLPVRGRLPALLHQPFTRLPRATWQRQVSREVVRSLSAEADVTYLHGLHVFGQLDAVEGPVVAHAVDPWSAYWAERAAHRRGLARTYDLVQSRRAARLEDRLVDRASSVVVVNAGDARTWAERSGARVVAVPNGTASPGDDDGAAGPPATVAFVGSLDYPPNVEALDVLVHEVLPLVRREVPGVRLVVAGRRPTADVLSLAGAGVEVRGDVPDVVEVFRSAHVAVYPGRTGRGTKNTVAEALGAGRPVVASVESSRGHSPTPALLVRSTSAEVAEAVVALLTDPATRMAAAAALEGGAAPRRSWQSAAQEFDRLLRAAAIETASR
ncbi:glycosyltransferase [Kineococcus rubinsiae]|uniref:glycosyltransferase n=1 Tax=Kineococcus rubinsiae TaxID=2609562 RepID=UPI00142FDF1A|nr:glycosyltransferase [Kineococcus rubinsiae]NIZ92031.1 glycosyltransferase [Kineococcus rubinsiae]